MFKRRHSIRSPSRISVVRILQILETLRAMDAKTFCDRWFDLDQLTAAQINETWQQRGHRAKCVRVLARVLNLEEKTIGNWGTRFERMPADHQPTLKYADALRRQIQVACEADMLGLVLETLDDPNE